MTGNTHLADLNGIKAYRVRIGFTDRIEPAQISGDGLPYVAVQDEIVANTTGVEAETMLDKHGRIPYGSPLYIWEAEINGKSKVLYIGQTMLQTLQRRFEGHSAVVKLLADHVSNQDHSVFVRLCSRFDIEYRSGNETVRRAIEHFPLVQAKKIVCDIEAYIIFKLKPHYNTQYKNREKVPHVPFEISEAQNISLS